MLDDVVALERQAIDEVVEGLTLVDVLARNARSHAGNLAISWHSQGNDHSLTWAEYRLRVMAVAAAMMEAGVGRGDQVAIIMGNRAEHVIADLAAIHAGATPVTVYSTLAPNQISYILDHCEAKLVLVETSATADLVAGLQIDSVRKIVTVRSHPGEGAMFVHWEAFEERGRALFAQDSREVERQAASVSSEDLATLIYTSGTTGTPKGVAVTHHNVLWTVETMRLAVDLPASPRLVSYLPLAHIAERAATHYLGMWLTGQVTYCANVAAIVNVLKQVRPHLFVGVPRIWETIADRVRKKLEMTDDPRRQRLVNAALSPNNSATKAKALDRLVLARVREELGFDDLKMAVTTAGPIDPELITYFRSLGIGLYELYGMTECCGPATTNVPGYDKIGTVGRALSGVEARIDEVGELYIRGGNVASGYFGDAEASAEAFSVDGWLRTGDLATIDAEGYITIVGRSKELIVTSSGKNIAPVHIEQLLKRSPIVGQVYVSGDQRPYLTAVIAIDLDNVPRQAADVSDPVAHPDVAQHVADAVAAANTEVAKIEQIKKYVIVADEWTPESGELTPSFKLKRRVVADKYAEQLNALYA